MGISEQDYQKAVAVVMDCSSGSVSNLQRKLYWGYARAAAAIDRMQEEFIVSPMHPSGRRDVYPSDIHQLWKDLNAAKAQAVPEGFVLLEKKGLRDTYYWDGCEYVVDCPSEYEMELERGEIVTLEKWQRTKETNVYCANIFSDEDNFELVQFDSIKDAEKAVAANKAMIEAQEPAPLKLGDLVKPIDHRYTLASGCERYPYAYVVNTNPFQLMSEEGDMYWRCTVEAGGYKLIKSNDQLPKAVSLRMIREGLLAPVETQEPTHD